LPLRITGDSGSAGESPGGPRRGDSGGKSPCGRRRGGDGAGCGPNAIARYNSACGPSGDACALCWRRASSAADADVADDVGCLRRRPVPWLLLLLLLWWWWGWARGATLLLCGGCAGATTRIREMSVSRAATCSRARLRSRSSRATALISPGADNASRRWRIRSSRSRNSRSNSTTTKQHELVSLRSVQIMHATREPRCEVTDGAPSAID
jgi:hypothetical protein